MASATSVINALASASAQTTSGAKTTGSVFYVGSTVTGAASTNLGLSPTSPFATLAQAVSAATASNGDTIYLMPGHAETIATAAGIDISKAGLTIIGLGVGTNRPTFSFSATASSLKISGANTILKNVITIPSVDEVVSAILVTAASVTLDAVDVYTVSSKQFIQWLLTEATADNLTIQNCKHWQPVAAGSAQVWIELVGGANAVIQDNDFDILAAASASSICLRASTATTNTRIRRNLICYRGASITSPISLITTSTGFINDNRIGMTSTSGTIDNIITGDTAFKFNNLVMDVAGTASGLLVPAVGTLT